MITVESRLFAFSYNINVRCLPFRIPSQHHSPCTLQKPMYSVQFPPTPHSFQSSNRSTPWVACHYRPCASALISSRIRCANASSLACRRASSSRSFACASAAASHTTSRANRSARFLNSPSTVPQSTYAFGPKPTMPRDETRQDQGRRQSRWKRNGTRHTGFITLAVLFQLADEILIVALSSLAVLKIPLLQFRVEALEELAFSRCDATHACLRQWGVAAESWGGGEARDGTVGFGAWSGRTNT
jgi:hypothetical protein